MLRLFKRFSFQRISFLRDDAKFITTGGGWGIFSCVDFSCPLPPKKSSCPLIRSVRKVLAPSFFCLCLYLLSAKRSMALIFTRQKSPCPTLFVGENGIPLSLSQLSVSPVVPWKLSCRFEYPIHFNCLFPWKSISETGQYLWKYTLFFISTNSISTASLKFGQKISTT